MTFPDGKWQKHSNRNFGVDNSETIDKLKALDVVKDGLVVIGATNQKTYSS
jgi:hypothetical protein